MFLKLISWNVRGLEGVKKMRSMRECISKCNPFILVLQETKKEVMNGHLVKSSMGLKLSEWCPLPAVSTLGGILIAWDPIEIRKVDELMGSYSVSIKVVELSSGFEWVLTGVYGPCKPHLRSEF